MFSLLLAFIACSAVQTGEAEERDYCEEDKEYLRTRIKEFRDCLKCYEDFGYKHQHCEGTFYGACWQAAR